jgi:hypothetical protein
MKNPRLAPQSPASSAGAKGAPSRGIAPVSPPIMIDDLRVYRGVLTLAQLEAIRLANIPPALWWDVNGATAGAGGPGGSVGIINFSNDVVLADNLFIEADKSLAVSNDLAVVPGLLTNATVKLQAQTNAGGILPGDANWSDYPGGGSSPVNVVIDPANPAVFSRLRTQ